MHKPCTLNVTDALCIRLHANNIYVQVSALDQLKAQVTALDQLKAPKLTDASVSMYVQPMITLYEWKGY